MLKQRIAVNDVDFDINDNLINCINCTINIDTLNVMEHSSSHLITKVTACNYNPNQSSSNSLFAKFIADIMDNNADDIKALRCLLGYILTSDNKQVMPILWGKGSNGKSVLITVLNEILSDYATTIDVKVLLESGNNFDTGEQANPQLYSIKGRKLVFVGENKSKKMFDEQLIKTIVGADTEIRVRLLRENTITFIPKCKLVMQTNNLPTFNSVDYGMSRRLLVYPFLKQFTEEEKDEKLLDKLLADRDSVFSYLIECVADYHQYGLYKSQNVLKATAKYNADNDIVEQFIDECCTTGVETIKVKDSDLYNAYKLWCKENGCMSLKKKNLLEQLADKGYTTSKINGYYYVKCLSLRADYDVTTGQYTFK